MKIMWIQGFILQRIRITGIVTKAKGRKGRGTPGSTGKGRSNKRLRTPETVSKARDRKVRGTPGSSGRGK